MMHSGKTSTERMASLVGSPGAAMTVVNFPNHMTWCVVLRTCVRAADGSASQSLSTIGRLGRLRHHLATRRRDYESDKASTSRLAGLDHAELGEIGHVLP